MQTLYRHSLPVRLYHWINLLALTLVLMSGLQIFNAHPALYWGNRSDAAARWLAMEGAADAHGHLRGMTTFLGYSFDTTGVLGVSSWNGVPEVRGFPRWATVPSSRWLAMGRRWHFFFAWILVINATMYIAASLWQGHIRRDLLPRGTELRGIVGSIRTHLRITDLRRSARHGYNVLQKLSYLLVLFVLGPLMVFTGLAMSPWMDAAFPPLLQIFDGRQSARSIHFLIAAALVAFTLVHVAMVLLVGPTNHIRAMITGRLRIDAERAP